MHDNSTPHICIAKIATTSSLSGLSELEYHVGYEVGTKDRIYIRIWKNSGGGKFNTDWISLGAIEKALSGIPADQPFLASEFIPLYAGQSANSPAFLAAAVLAEDWIVRSETEPRRYVRGNADIWQAQMRALAETGTNLVPLPIEHTADHSAVPPAKPAKQSKKSAQSANV